MVQDGAGAAGTIGGRVRQARSLVEHQVHPRLTAHALSLLAGLAGGYVLAIEKGLRLRLGGDVVARLAATLGVSCDWLLSGTGPAPEAELVVRAVEAARAARAQRQAGQSAST